jgi:hypothetical protein
MAIIGTLLVLRGYGRPDSGISQSVQAENSPMMSPSQLVYDATTRNADLIEPHGSGKVQSANLTIPTCSRHATCTVHRRPAAVGVIVEMDILI